MKKECGISVQVDGKTKEKLRYLAKATQRSVASYVRLLLRFHIQEYETLYHTIETDQTPT